MKFTNPLYVSSEPDKDHISVKFVTNKLFMSKADNLTLAENYTIENIMLPAQIPEEDLKLVTTIANSA